MKKTLFVFAAVLVLVSARFTLAQSPVPTKNFGQEVKTLREENREMRQELRGTMQLTGAAQREENKETREQFREQTKEMLLSTTPGQRKGLLPIIKSQRKTMNQGIVSNNKAIRIANWASLDKLRATIRTSWTNLWSSFFGKK